jgi:hypothetical protein
MCLPIAAQTDAVRPAVVAQAGLPLVSILSWRTGK